LINYLDERGGSVVDENILIDIESLSHFKAKQDNEYTGKFRSKDEPIDLKGAVRYDAAQALTEEQKAQARANIGAGTSDLTESGEGAVRYNVEQALDEDDKERARANIGAGTSNFDGDYNNLKNRTHSYEEFSSQFDGNETPNPDTLSATGLTWYKISDLTPSKEDILVATLVFNDESAITVTEENIGSVVEIDNEPKAMLISLDNGNRQIVVVYTTQDFSFQNNGSTVSITKIPSVGIYWALTSGVANKKFSIEYGCLRQLDDKFIPNNIPRLTKSGLIPSNLLPGFIDDVIDGYYNPEDYLFYEDAEFTKPIVGESGKVYVDIAKNLSYRFSGTIFGLLNPPEYTIATNADIDLLFT
jgi:hypothetical protein